VHAIAGDTDGVDGAEEIAGATADARYARDAPGRSASTRAASLDATTATASSEALGDSVVTGPTPDQRERLPGHRHRWPFDRSAVMNARCNAKIVANARPGERRPATIEAWCAPAPMCSG
jgi:hypothetical protein